MAAACRAAAPPLRADETIKVVGLRRKIAENMQEAKRRIPHFTLVEEFDVTALEETRAMMNRDRGSNPKLTLLPFLITAMGKALPEWPMLNATYDDDANVITRHGALHLGMATQTPNGLMVAVIRDAQNKNVWQLASEILRLADAARSGKAAREELMGSTITLSSLGPMGGITSTPVINRPEVAIIAVNKVEDKLVPIDGEIEVRKRMNLSLSCDHRVVDGWDAASFMQTSRATSKIRSGCFRPEAPVASSPSRLAPASVRGPSTPCFSCRARASSSSLDIVFLRGALDPAPRRVALVIADALDLVEARDRVADMAGVVSGSLRSFGNANWSLVDMIALFFAEFGHEIAPSDPINASRRTAFAFLMFEPPRREGKARGLGMTARGSGAMAAPPNRSGGEANGFAKRLVDRLLRAAPGRSRGRRRRRIPARCR